MPNAGIFDEVIGWFSDIVANGPPGTFSFSGPSYFNPIQNADVPAGASTNLFFARTVNAGGAAPFTDPTSDVTVSFTSNVVSSRVTAGRSILGVTTQAGDGDVPPGPGSTVGTPGFLPFFLTLQRGIPGIFSADVTIAYTTTELGIAGIAPGSPEESALVIARFNTGTCTVGGAVCSENGNCGANGPCIGTGYTALPTTVNTAQHTATATGLTSFSTLAVVHPDTLTGGFQLPRVPGGGTRATDCRGEFQVANPTNTPFLDGKGFPNRIQACTDGDPACDADRTADGTCTFRVSICFDQTDANLPDCTAGGLQRLRGEEAGPAGQGSGRRGERAATGRRADGARRHGHGVEGQRRPLHGAAGGADVHRVRLLQRAAPQRDEGEQDGTRLRRGRRPVPRHRSCEAALPACELAIL